jgi:hypothetical protein
VKRIAVTQSPGRQKGCRLVEDVPVTRFRLQQLFEHWCLLCLAWTPKAHRVAATSRTVASPGTFCDVQHTQRSQNSEMDYDKSAGQFGLSNAGRSLFFY